MKYSYRSQFDAFTQNFDLSTTKRSVIDAVRRLPERNLDIDSILARYELKLPTVDFSNFGVDSNQRTIKTNDVFGRIRPTQVNFYIYSFPYSGNADLLKYRPSTYDLAPQPTLFITNKAIFFEVADYINPMQPRKDQEALKAEATRTIERLKTFMDRLGQDFERHNIQLRLEVEQVVQERQQQIANTNKTLEFLKNPNQKQNG
jgi:hypothetical protein